MSGGGTRFAGYAALFDLPDKGGDVIRKGAFAHCLKPGLPLFAQHDSRRRIGTVEALEEDARGLRVLALVEPGVAVRAGQGLSFGYKVRQARQGHHRELMALDLMEVSLVTSPMQPQARVLAVARVGASP